MGVRQEYEKRVDKKQREIAELEGQLRESKAVLQAYLEFLRHLPQESGDGKTATGSGLRPGTDLYKAWQYLTKLGRPAYITELLKGIGKEPTKENRVSLSGNLSWHVRKGETFTRPKPNTFGLVGMSEEETELLSPEDEAEPDALPLDE